MSTTRWDIVCPIGEPLGQKFGGDHIVTQEDAERMIRAHDTLGGATVWPFAGADARNASEVGYVLELAIADGKLWALHNAPCRDGEQACGVIVFSETGPLMTNMFLSDMPMHQTPPQGQLPVGLLGGGKGGG